MDEALKQRLAALRNKAFTVETPISASIAVEEPPAVEATPIVEETDKGHAPQVMTEDSPMVQELKDSEPSDDELVEIGGAYYSKNNPFFRKLLEVWKADADSEAGIMESLSQDRRIQLLEPHELAQLLMNKELTKEFGISELSLFRETFNMEVMRVKDMSHAQLMERIERHRRMITQMETCIQADQGLAIEKRKREKAEANKEGDDKFRATTADKFKKRLASRKVSTKGLTEEEKLIQSWMQRHKCSLEEATAKVKLMLED